MTLEFNNSILREIPDSSNIYADGTSPVSSTTFTFSNITGCTLRDNGNGVMQVVQASSEGVTIVKNEIGTVDYTTGTVKLTNFNVSNFNGEAVVVSINPVSKTLSSSKNIILSYNKTPSITIEQERI